MALLAHASGDGGAKGIASVDDHDMAGSLGCGGHGEDAMGVMNLMIRGEIGAGDVPLLRDRLLRYCERDTEATARILDALRSMAFD